VTPVWSHLPVLLGPPLDPSPDKARSLLRRELLRPEYNDSDPIQRLLDWLQRMVDDALRTASGAPALPSIVAIALFLVLLLVLAWFLSRARRSRPADSHLGAVLTDERPSARELRERAEAALASGRAEDAVVDGFRALTTRQVERGRLDDLPGATAHEVAARLAMTFPHQRPRVNDSANLFDRVLYGDRPASPEQAAEVLTLDDELARVG
jgi:cbb3-type cytochrome oxidase subunit 3